MNTQFRNSITPVAAAVTAALYPGFTALAQDTGDDSYALEEIIVTATKRELSVQDILFVEIFFKFALATLIGFLIGLEREMRTRHQHTGLRDFILVSLL